MKKSQVCFLSQKVKVKGRARTVTSIVVFNFFQHFLYKSVSVHVCFIYSRSIVHAFSVLRICMIIMLQYFIPYELGIFLQDLFLTASADFLLYRSTLTSICPHLR